MLRCDGRSARQLERAMPDAAKEAPFGRPVRPRETSHFVRHTRCSILTVFPTYGGSHDLLGCSLSCHRAGCSVPGLFRNRRPFDEHRLDTICRRLGTGRDLLHRRTSPTGPIAEQAVRILHSLRLVVLPSRGVAFCTRTCRSNERLASTSCSSRVALHTRVDVSRTLGARTVRPHGRLSGLDPA
jgi:hypothetical protein